MEVVFSLILIIIVPAILIYTLITMEPFGIVKPRILLMSIAWGIFIYFIAELFQVREFEDMQDYILVVTFLFAPLLEELLKIIFLFIIYNRTLARYAGDGLVYGFTIGSGFAVAENIAYMLQYSDQALNVTLARVASSGLFHASLTAILGALICGVIYYRRAFTYPFFFFLYVFAVFTHLMFNAFAVSETIINDSLASIIIGMVMLIIVYGIMVFVRFREVRLITHRIAEELTPMELIAIKHGGDVLNDLEKQHLDFGENQNVILRDYLLSEAQIALFTRESIKGRGKRQNIQKVRDDIERLREQIENMKKQLSPEATNWLERERLKFSEEINEPP